MAQSFWSSVRVGVAYGLPVQTALAPMAMLFGALALGRGGLSGFDTILMSAVVFAGSAQFVAIDLYGQKIPMWSVVLSVFAVNFRHLLYSAAVTKAVRSFPWRVKLPLFFLLTDPTFAFIQEERQRLNLAAYFGLGVSLYVVWLGGTALGVLFGSFLTDPEAYALDMLLPIYFVALVMSFRRRPNWALTVVVTFIVSGIVYKAPEWGITFLGTPWHMTIGCLGGMLAAAIVARPGSPPLSAPEEPELQPHLSLVDPDAPADDGQMSPAR